MSSSTPPTDPHPAAPEPAEAERAGEPRGSGDRFCIIGAGAAGLAAAKAFEDARLHYEVLEGSAGIGGIWDVSRVDSPIARNTHTIASRSLQRFADLPLPESAPVYPRHEQVLRYLREFAERFGIRPKIKVNALVTRVAPATGGDGRWNVTLADGSSRRYAGVVIATGHDRTPRVPALPGDPAMEVLHSSRYRDPVQIRDKRVLVVGAGQSAADLLTDCAVNAAVTLHSSRGGVFCMPKYMLGRPTDTMLQIRAWRPLRRTCYVWFFRYLRRRSRAMGLPVPDFADGLAIPVVGDLLHHHYTHGDISHRGDIADIEGTRVMFADGTDAHVDVIYLATGFVPSYPFVEPRYLGWAEGAPAPDLYLHIFPRDPANLFVVGMVRPIGSHWDVYEQQARLITAYLHAATTRPAGARRFERMCRSPQPDLRAGLRFHHAESYPLVVEKQEYLRQLRRHRRTLAK